VFRVRVSVRYWCRFCNALVGSGILILGDGVWWGTAGGLEGDFGGFALGADSLNQDLRDFLGLSGWEGGLVDWGMGWAAA